MSRRYIDVDALGIGKADRNAFTIPEYADGWNSAIDVIANAPTADVVEVVRCKDCKHWEEHGIDYLTKRPFCSCKCEYWEHPTEYFTMLDNDFCSYGERREENGT